MKLALFLLSLTPLVAQSTSPSVPPCANGVWVLAGNPVTLQCVVLPPGPVGPPGPAGPAGAKGTGMTGQKCTPVTDANGVQQPTPVLKLSDGTCAFLTILMPTGTQVAATTATLIDTSPIGVFFPVIGNSRSVDFSGQR